MYKHITVPLDGSVQAEAILPLVVQLARRMRARVTLLHVVEPNAPRTIHGERHLASASEALAYLGEVKQRFFAHSTEVAIDVRDPRSDGVARNIVSHAAQAEGDLIAICTHGRSGLPRFVFGSLAQQVVNLGRKPVLVLYPHRVDRPLTLEPLNILVALDGNPEHEQGLQAALALAQSGPASLHLVLAVPTLGTLAGEQTPSAIRLPGTTRALLEIHRERGVQYLRDLIRRAGDAAASASIEVERGDPASVVVDAVRASGSNLIVMATHGKASMESFWLGSLTPKVARRSHVPLLLVPAGPAQGPASGQ